MNCIFLSRFLTFLLLSHTLSESQALIDMGSIDQFVEDFRLSSYVPALGLSISLGDESIAKSYGLSKVEENVRADNSTIFAIGSISKSFTGVLVAKVLSEKFPELGESVLDIPLRKHFPTINFTLIDRYRSESVSFRDLLSHRLCIQPDWLGQTTLPFKSVFEYLYRIRYAPEVCPFRTQWVYNNGAFVMASELIAKMSGKTLAVLMNEFFRDIGMTQTSFVQESVDYDNLPNMSKAYYRNGTQMLPFSTGLLKRLSLAAGAGGILSTPNDMLKYMHFHLQNGKVGNTQVVSEAAMKWVRTGANAVPFEAPRTELTTESGDFAYGLGINIGTHDGWQRISHGGYVPPYLSFFAYFPTLKMGIFTCTNGPGQFTDLHRLQAGIFNILRGENPTTVENLAPNSKLEQSLPSNNTFKNQIRSTMSAEFVGIYGNGLSGEFEITSLEGTTSGELYIRYGTWGTGILSPKTDTIFEIQWDSDLAQEIYTYGPVLVPLLMDFGEPKKGVIIWMDGTRFVFEKDVTLDKLPEQPWEGDIECEGDKESNSGTTISAGILLLAFSCISFLARL